jgi:hypothetical protein
VLNISFIPLVYFCYPETKGITLEQIDRIFVGEGTGLGALTQGVKESLHLKRDIDQHELNSDEESGIKDEGDNDAHGEHIEIAKA